MLCEPSGRPPRVTARVDAVLGDPFAPRSFSLIAIHKHGLRDDFREEAIDEADRVAKLPLGEREDLTHLPIVAIDPTDARDHDDAIWAEPRDGRGRLERDRRDRRRQFLRPARHRELDREARARGNSVYFPDRVVPMLPEELSADICSLKQGQVRAAMACHLQIDKDGHAQKLAFHARQNLRRGKYCLRGCAGRDRCDGEERARSRRHLLDAGRRRLPFPRTRRTALKPLWACWRALLAARNKREPLELDIPERRVVLDEKGRILSVAPRERLDAHRLVEDYMIAANVAAAQALEAKKAPVMYRVHEAPSREKLIALKDYLATFGVEFALGQVIKPGDLQPHHRADRRRATAAPEIMEQLLRTQMQARYGPERLGHFGLALASYAHFTSPIRRYADLLVHRALVSAYRLGEGGLPRARTRRSTRIGEQISMLERRAMEAERDTVDRYVAAFLADRVGQMVDCRITGVQPFGFFATVESLGGDGLVLAATLGSEYFRYDEKARTLVGDETGETYRVGQRLQLRLAEANPVSGALRFELPEGSYGGAARAPRPDAPATRRGANPRGRPANIRHQGRRR